MHTPFIKKYNVPGPRYTSYPTVPYWETSPTSDEWITHLRSTLQNSEARDVGAALYVHIPFCQSLCTYCGCNTRITRNTKVGSPYVDTVLKEWDLYLKALDCDAAGSAKLPLTEIHLGGGTPTFLEPKELEKLVLGILERTRPLPGAEFSVEADPRVTTRAHLETLAKLGFNRLSLGVQDFDPKVQEIVHRVQSEAQVREVTETARSLGFKSINYDLIYGLPFQTKESVESTIDAVMRLKPDRIAFYAYAHVPWIKPSQRRFTEDDLPAGDLKRELYELGRAKLEAVGYREIGMDHFALETDSLWKSSQDKSLFRNFMGYTSRQVAPLIGLGVSAIGDSWSAFAQNEKLLETYVARVEKGELPILRGHLLNREDEIVRRHILNLMTKFETEWTEGSTDFETPLKEVPARLSELVTDGLVRIDQKAGSVKIKVTPEGRAYLRNVCMAFDLRLVRRAPLTELFSKTI